MAGRQKRMRSFARLRSDGRSNKVGLPRMSRSNPAVAEPPRRLNRDCGRLPPSQMCLPCLPACLSVCAASHCISRVHTTTVCSEVRVCLSDGRRSVQHMWLGLRPEGGRGKMCPRGAQRAPLGPCPELLPSTFFQPHLHLHLHLQLQSSICIIERQDMPSVCCSFVTARSAQPSPAQASPTGWINGRKGGVEPREQAARARSAQ